MNKRQKEYLKYSLEQEKQIIEELKQIYSQALQDIDDKIAMLMGRTDLENLQSIIYQLDYQKALKTQINAILDNMQGNQYQKIQDYLEQCYENGFLGTMYDLHGQGIPIVTPINQEQVLNALVTDTKLSKKLYTKLGEDVSLLKKRVSTTVSRGIASNMSYSDIARNISNDSNVTMNNAIRIARTEGHRIQAQSSMDAAHKAKEAGADLVKQWDSTLDSKTRPTHQTLDGQIRELDEPFEVNGFKAMQPGAFGVPHMDINCRCVILQRARWAVEDETVKTKWDNENGELIEYTDFEDFKNKYLLETEKLTRYDGFDITDDGKYKILPYDNVKDYEAYIKSEFEAQNVDQKDWDILWSKDSGYIQNSSGYKAINNYMRGIESDLDLKYNKTMQTLIDVTSNNVLQKDYIGYRKVQPSYLSQVLGIDTDGLLSNVGKSREKFKNKSSMEKLVKAINDLVGTKQAFVKDKAVTSISLAEKLNYFDFRPLLFEIQMPSGTNGIITANYPESEFIAKPGTTLEILGSMLYNDDGKECIKIFARIVND